MLVKTKEGIPQGEHLSPLFSNTILDKLDKELERRRHKCCKYAGDRNTYVKSIKVGERILESITKFLKYKLKLKLKVNKEKSAILSPTKSFYYYKGKSRFRVHPKSYDRLKSKIRNITNRNISMNFKYRLKRLWLVG